MQHSFRTKGDNHLDLEKGDVVLVFDRPERSWWRGIIGEREGLFPAEFLQGCMFA